jgi:hypothetical protein
MSRDGWPVLPDGVRPEDYKVVSEDVIEEESALRAVLGNNLVDLAAHSPQHLQVSAELDEGSDG